jgi:hypothetical protein
MAIRVPRFLQETVPSVSCVEARRDSGEIVTTRSGIDIFCGFIGRNEESMA